MKKLLTMCLLALSVLTLTSCGSKVDEKELNTKIENWTFTDGLGNFNQDEFKYMVEVLKKQIDSKKDVDPTGPEAQRLGMYMMILNIADSQNKLEGKTKEQWEALNKKMESLYEEPTLPDFSEEVPEMTEVVEDTYDTVGTYTPVEAW